jgi:hypothetical protein
VTVAASAFCWSCCCHTSLLGLRSRGLKMGMDWQKAVGYGKRSLVEVVMRLFSDNQPDR